MDHLEGIGSDIGWMSRGSWDGSGLVGQDGIQVSGIWIFRGVFRARRVASRYYYQNGKRPMLTFWGEDRVLS